MEIRLEDILREKGPAFSFYELIRLLESIHQDSSGLGREGPAREEKIRLRPDIALSFPRSDVTSVESKKDASGRERFLITVGFLGLYGPASPLPSFFTESIYDDDDEDATRARAFLDILHHRLLSLLYRSWTKYRYPVVFSPNGQDVFSRNLIPLTGGENVEDSGFSPLELLRGLGHLTRLPRSASGLQGLLEEFLDGIPVTIQECAERWAYLKPDQKSSLGRANASLGLDCLAGEKVKDRGGKFRIVIGPVRYEDFLTLLPQGERYKRLRSLVRLFLIDPLEFEVEAVLMGEETPPAVLDEKSAMHLGWNSWLSAGSGPDKAVTFHTERG